MCLFILHLLEERDACLSPCEPSTGGAPCGKMGCGGDVRSVPCIYLFLLPSSFVFRTSREDTLLFRVCVRSVLVRMDVSRNGMCVRTQQCLCVDGDAAAWVMSLGIETAGESRGAACMHVVGCPSVLRDDLSVAHMPHSFGLCVGARVLPLQVPRILGPLVLCLEKLPEVYESKPAMRNYFDNQFGGLHALRSVKVYIHLLSPPSLRSSSRYGSVWIPNRTARNRETYKKRSGEDSCLYVRIPLPT